MKNKNSKLNLCESCFMNEKSCGSDFCEICIDNGDYWKKEIKFERPPLGLIPRWVQVEQRYGAVCAAISRYYNAGKKIPIEWIEEYNELIDEL